MSRILDQEGKADSVRRVREAPLSSADQPAQPEPPASGPDGDPRIDPEVEQATARLVDHVTADLEALSGRLAELGQTLDSPVMVSRPSPSRLSLKPPRVAWPSLTVAAIVVALTLMRVRAPHALSTPAAEAHTETAVPMVLAMNPIPVLPDDQLMRAPTLLITEGEPLRPGPKPIPQMVLAAGALSCEADRPAQIASIAHSPVSSAIPVSVRRRRPVNPDNLHSLPTPRKSGADVFRPAEL
jgi:hypothetical protein